MSPECSLIVPIQNEPAYAPEPDNSSVLVRQRIDVPDELEHCEEPHMLCFGRVAAADEEGRIVTATVARTGCGDGYEVNFVFKET
jgi:hypothetical protein